ncbi:serine hydrolase [Bradyrhizobium arachidis]
MVAATTLALVEEGKLRLDEPVDRRLPELASRRVVKTLSGQVNETVSARRPVLVSDLLTMRMGRGGSWWLAITRSRRPLWRPICSFLPNARAVTRRVVGAFVAPASHGSSRRRLAI